MAMERIYGGMWIPAPPPFGTAVPAFVSMLLYELEGHDRVAFIFQSPKTGTLDKFEFRIGASTQLPANGLKCSFQDVDLATGDPDGSVDQYRSVTGLTVDSWIAPGLITSDGTDSGAKRTTVRGDWLACVIETQSWSAGDIVNVSALNVSSTAFMGSPVYSDVRILSSWTKQTNMPIMALKYDDGTYENIFGCLPIKSLHTVDFNVESGYRGLAFSFPTDVLLGGTYVRMDFNVAASVNSMIMELQNDQSEVLGTLTLDANVHINTSCHYHVLRFPSDQLIRANEVYRVVIYPDANNMNFYDFDVNSVEIMGATDGGQNFCLWEGGGTESAAYNLTRRPWAGLIITGVDHEIGGNPTTGWQGVP